MQHHVTEQEIIGAALTEGFSAKDRRNEGRRREGSKSEQIALPRQFLISRQKTACGDLTFYTTALSSFPCSFRVFSRFPPNCFGGK